MRLSFFHCSEQEGTHEQTHRAPIYDRRNVGRSLRIPEKANATKTDIRFVSEDYSALSDGAVPPVDYSFLRQSDWRVPEDAFVLPSERRATENESLDDVPEDGTPSLSAIDYECGAPQTRGLNEWISSGAAETNRMPNVGADYKSRASEASQELYHESGTFFHPAVRKRYEGTNPSKNKWTLHEDNVAFRRHPSVSRASHYITEHSLENDTTTAATQSDVPSPRREPLFPECELVQCLGEPQLLSNQSARDNEVDQSRTLSSSQRRFKASPLHAADPVSIRYLPDAEAASIPLALANTGGVCSADLGCRQPNTASRTPTCDDASTEAYGSVGPNTRESDQPQESFFSPQEFPSESANRRSPRPKKLFLKKGSRNPMTKIPTDNVPKYRYYRNPVMKSAVEETVMRAEPKHPSMAAVNDGQRRRPVRREKTAVKQNEQVVTQGEVMVAPGADQENSADSNEKKLDRVQKEKLKLDNRQQNETPDCASRCLGDDCDTVTPRIENYLQGLFTDADEGSAEKESVKESPRTPSSVVSVTTQKPCVLKANTKRPGAGPPRGQSLSLPSLSKVLLGNSTGCYGDMKRREIELQHRQEGYRSRPVDGFQSSSVSRRHSVPVRQTVAEVTFRSQKEIVDSDSRNVMDLSPVLPGNWIDPFTCLLEAQRAFYVKEQRYRRFIEHLGHQLYLERQANALLRRGGSCTREVPVYTEGHRPSYGALEYCKAGLPDHNILEPSADALREQTLSTEEGHLQSLSSIQANGSFHRIPDTVPRQCISPTERPVTVDNANENPPIEKLSLEQAWAPFDAALQVFFSYCDRPVDGPYDDRYEPYREEVCAATGMRKIECTYSKWIFHFFANGDLRGISPSGYTYYYFNADSIYSITTPEGTTMNCFPDGQIDYRLPDGSVNVRFPVEHNKPAAVEGSECHTPVGCGGRDYGCLS